MKRVTGIGGIFFKASDPKKLGQWYKKHLGIDVDDKVEESEYGKFGWVMDPEGNRIELWQAPNGQ